MITISLCRRAVNGRLLRGPRIVKSFNPQTPNMAPNLAAWYNSRTGRNIERELAKFAPTNEGKEK